MTHHHILMERVSRLLEDHGPMPVIDVVRRARGKSDHLRGALADLRALGFVSSTWGPGGALINSSAEPYRVAEHAEHDALTAPEPIVLEPVPDYTPARAPEHDPLIVRHVSQPPARHWTVTSSGRLERLA
ncbi:hypothetical protein AADG42_05615 [Ammonicoccus fulvus]|uniref:Transcriptional regulator n=1 Tax=Ammonicoccus fulvus TaxID=3138240 RepID=A0ABZ3FL84_9ACTN